MSATLLHPPARLVRKDIEGIQEIRGRTIEFIASQEIVDRDGDLIRCAGIDVHDFMRNPVLLGDHDKTFVLGKITNLWKDQLPDGWALLGKADILPEGTSRRADEAYGEIKFGARAGISIGFLPKAYDKSATGYVFKSVSLLEISSVALPSCPSALITAKSAAWRRKEDAMGGLYLELADDDPGAELADAIVRVLETRLVPRMARAIADHIEIESDEEQQRRLATAHREATNRWMNDKIRDDLRYKEQQRQWLLAVTPRPQHPAPGGWY